MPEESNYKPSLPNDKQYISDVAKVIKEREPFEDVKFEYLTEALVSLGILQNPYSLVSLEDLNSESLRELVLESFEKIAKADLNEQIESRLFRLWDYLVAEDQLEKADLIFVFGGSGLNRVNEAVRLWQEGLAEKILFTGQQASYMKDLDVTEAEYYAQIAKLAGVPESALILEVCAKNTPENVRNSIKELHKVNFLPKKIILITLAYHMRRSYLTFKSAAEWDPILIKHPVASAKFTREDYFKSSEGWSYVFFEYIKMYGARLMKHF